MEENIENKFYEKGKRAKSGRKHLISWVLNLIEEKFRNTTFTTTIKG